MRGSLTETSVSDRAENVKKYLLDNPEFMAEVEKQVKDHVSELSNQMRPSYKGGQMHSTPVNVPPTDISAEEPVPTTAASAKAKLDITVDD